MAASRTNVGALRLGIRAIDQANLGADRRRESEEPAEGVGDRLTSHVDAGLHLSLAGGLVDPGLHGWKADALHYKVLNTIPGEALIDPWDGRCARRALECYVDESPGIALVEGVHWVKLNDITVEEEDTRHRAVLPDGSKDNSAVPNN